MYFASAVDVRRLLACCCCCKITIDASVKRQASYSRQQLLADTHTNTCTYTYTCIKASTPGTVQRKSSPSSARSAEIVKKLLQILYIAGYNNNNCNNGNYNRMLGHTADNKTTPTAAKTTTTTLQCNQQRHMRRPLAAIAQNGSPSQVPGAPLKG